MRMREVCEYCEICVRKRRHLSFAEKERRTNAPSDEKLIQNLTTTGFFRKGINKIPPLYFTFSSPSSLFLPPLQFARAAGQTAPAGRRSLQSMKKEEPPARRTENRVSTAAEKGNELVEK